MQTQTDCQYTGLSGEGHESYRFTPSCFHWASREGVSASDLCCASFPILRNHTHTHTHTHTPTHTHTHTHTHTPTHLCRHFFKTLCTTTMSLCEPNYFCIALIHDAFSEHF